MLPILLVFIIFTIIKLVDPCTLLNQEHNTPISSLSIVAEYPLNCWFLFSYIMQLNRVTAAIVIVSIRLL